VDHGYVGSVDRVEFTDGAAEAIGFQRAGIYPFPSLAAAAPFIQERITV
jgi:hypothetical protein